jgi:hypothetical protein
MPPEGGIIRSRVLKMVVAGVIGYPAKKPHPEAIAPHATASFPSIRLKGIYILPIIVISIFSHEEH